MYSPRLIWNWMMILVYVTITLMIYICEKTLKTIKILRVAFCYKRIPANLPSPKTENLLQTVRIH